MESNQREWLPFEAALPWDIVMSQLTPLSRVLFGFLFVETLLCGLTLASIGEVSRPPMALSGIVVLSQVGAIGFSLCVIAFLFVGIHARKSIRLVAGTGMLACFVFSNLLGVFINSGLNIKYGSSMEMSMLQLTPLGCAVAGLPVALAVVFFRKRVKSHSDLSMGEPMSIRKLMLITALVAALATYAKMMLDLDSQSERSLFGLELFLPGSLILLGGVIFLIALEGLNEKRNTLRFWLMAFGGPALLGLVLTLVVGYWFPITQVVGYLAIVAGSFLLHTVLFCWALKSAGFVFARVEIE